MNNTIQLYQPGFFPDAMLQRLIRANMKLEAKEMRANSLLRQDEWKQLDRTLTQFRNQTLNGVADLINRGLTHPLGNIGVVIAEWEKIHDIEDAEVSMSPASVVKEDTLSFDLDGVPVPIIHKNFRYEIRRIQAARNNGTALDTTQQGFAARKVFEAIENMLFNGYSLTVGGYTIYGYRNHPNRATGSLTAAWDGTATVAQVLSDIRDMLDDADALDLTGPYIIYVPKGWMNTFRLDYNSTYPSKTLMDRVLDYQEIEAVKPTSMITADVQMVEMQSNTVDLAIASDVVNLQWDEQAGLITRFKVMGSMVPRIKADANDVTGIIHYS